MLQHPSANHDDHDACWCVLSTHHQLPVCIACTVEKLEDQSMTPVQQQFNLTLLSSVLAENDEVSSLLREHLPVCQVILDIVTEQYCSRNSESVSVEICSQILDSTQEKELYIYLLDKLQTQVQQTPEIVPFILTLLGKLGTMSPAYTFTLVHTHDGLLRSLLETETSCVMADENVQCSLSFLLTQLLDGTILPAVPPDILPVLERHLLSWLSSAQLLNLQINMLAVLKGALQSDSMLEEPGMWSPLCLGLKRIFVSKREILQTAATQCLAIIATSQRHTRYLQQALESDLPEFLFESLHTTNSTQLESVFSCLHLFAEHALFFERCHALYGMESVLHALSATLETMNVAVLDKGFSLLVTLLERQPETIPLFVNKSAEQLTLSIISKGVEFHQIQVSVMATKAAGAYFLHPGLCHSQLSSHITRRIVHVCFGRLVDLSRQEGSDSLQHLGIGDGQLMDVLLKLFTVVSRVAAMDEDLLKQILKKCDEEIIPYFTESWSRCDHNLLNSLFCFLDAVFDKPSNAGQHLCERLLSSGFIMQILMLKFERRGDLGLTTAASSVLVKTFTVMLHEHCPQLSSLPESLQSGLRKLHLRDTLQQTVEDVRDDDTAVALCMVLYFLCIENDVIFPPGHVLSTIEVLHSCEMLHLQGNPLTAKFLLFLLAWSRTQMESELASSEQTRLQSAVEQSLIENISALPVDAWATPCLSVFLWLFSDRARAAGPGRRMMEHWLLHTHGKLADSDRVFLTLFGSSTFRQVLYDMMAASEEVSILARKFVLQLLSVSQEYGSENVDITTCLQEVSEHCCNLFLQSVHPDGHVISSFLQVLSAFVRQAKDADIDSIRYVKTVYHVTRLIGKLDSSKHNMLQGCLTFLHSLALVTNQDQDMKVIPVMLQSGGFLMKLESCLTIQELSALGLCVVAWASTVTVDCMCVHPIRISTKCLIESVAKPPGKHSATVPALRILYQALMLNTSSPVLTFHRDDSLVQDRSLFTSKEIRLLYGYLQQLVCQEDTEVQFCATQCLMQLFEYSSATDSLLGEHLVHHPWNKPLVGFILSMSATQGMQSHLADLIGMMWTADDGADPEMAKWILEVLISVDITDENIMALSTLLDRAKDISKDTDLVHKAETRFQEFRCDSLPHLQSQRPQDTVPA